MIISFSVAMSMAAVWASKSLNPVKTSMGVLMAGGIMFLSLSLMSGSTWMPIIMVMLFVGGILMMFMILSSILPNEKSAKSKIYLASAGILMFAMLSSSSFEGSTKGMESQSYLMSGASFYAMMILILVYFMNSMSLMSAEESPMRSYSCPQDLTL